MVTRAEHRTATLLQLGDAAVQLFASQGPSVTIAEIAEKAGMSRRTVFRWVDSKEQLAFVHPLLWIDIFDEAWALTDDAEPVYQRLLTATRAIADHVDADPGPPAEAFMVAVTHPELFSGFNGIRQRWVAHLTTVIATAAGPDPDDFRSVVLGSAVMGMVDAATQKWLLSMGELSYEKALLDGWGFLKPLFDQ